MSEMDYFAALGVSESDMDSTDDSATEVDDVQESAGPAADESIADSKTPEGAPGKADGGAADKKSRSRQRKEDAIYAKARATFEKERDAAIAAAKEEARLEAQRALQVEADKIVAAMKIENPRTGRPINSKAEYDQYLAERESEQIDDELQTSGLSKETLQAIIKNTPEVKAAAEASQEFKAAAERAKLEKAKLVAEAEIKEISKYDPAIKSIDDLRKMADYDKFRSLVVNNRLSYLDAFRLLRYEQLTTGREAGAARQAAFNAASKAHLQRSDGAGEGADSEVTVTDADLSRYRQFFPEMSAKEIRQYAQRYATKTKRTD